MKHLIFICFFTFLFNFGFGQTFTFSFETDSFNLTQEHIIKLDEIISTINIPSLESMFPISLVGEADSRASFQYNKLLSKKRVVSIKNYLLSKGIEDEFISWNYIGETYAVSEDHQLYRRVTMQVDNRFCSFRSKETTIKDLYKLTELDLQQFCINNKKDTILYCQQGTIIQIKANSFTNANDSECILFEVKEAYLKSDMVLENLSTTSDERLIETMGMVYTQASQNNKDLSLEKELIFLMPADEIVEDAQIFDGERDAHSEIMNWTVSNNSVLRNFSINDLAYCPKIVGTGNRSDFMGCCYPNPCNSLCMAIDSLSMEECFKNLGIICKSKVECPKCKFFSCTLASAFNEDKKEIKKAKKECKALNKEKKNDKKSKNKKSEKQKPIDWNNRSARNINKIKKTFIRPGVLDGYIEPNENEKEILELTANILEADQLIINGYVNRNTLVRCNELDSLFNYYNIDSTSDLIYYINKPLMDEFGVNTMEDLLDTLPKANLSSLELKYQNKEISFEDYKFYIFNSSSLGWKNCDVFRDVLTENQTTINVMVKPDLSNDVKLIFKDREFVLPGKVGLDYYYFENIPNEELAWIVALKYNNGIPQLAMKEINISKGNYEVEFVTYSLEELKIKLKILDFNK